MAYVSLYRKWRPQTFADIVGQDHVTGTLVNAIRTGQVHHAMLFTGTRGTGKTSTARVLAKALNCQRGPTPEPDNTCEQCRSITDGTNLDVVEIDAASHGSVDDTRDLREKASYAPAAARYKVYIVDEAHMVNPADRGGGGRVTDPTRPGRLARAPARDGRPAQLARRAQPYRRWSARGGWGQQQRATPRRGA